MSHPVNLLMINWVSLSKREKSFAVKGASGVMRIALGVKCHDIKKGGF